jgi:hypothetical protein
MLDFSGRQAVVSGPDTLLWSAGQVPAVISDQHAVLASFAHDVMFLRTSAQATGPTAISAPGTPAWTAPFLPTAVSADGTLVVGHAVHDGSRIEVRRVADGHLMADLRVPGHSSSAPLWFQDVHHVLFQAHVAHEGSSLFRCDLAGSCTRTWKWLPTSVFSSWHFSGPVIGVNFF